jgi:hypothetical protein
MAGHELELVGKVVSKALKDVGKGKDAEAHEVIVVTVKLDGTDGIRGSLYFVPGERHAEFDLGDPIHVQVAQRQGKLGLAGRH